MPPAEPPNEVILRVKVPPGHIPGAQQDEYTLGTMSTTLSLGALRQRIQTLVPTNPSPTSQRILYGGRALLDDNQSIADVLNTKRDPSQTEYVVHLLLRDSHHTQATANEPRVPSILHQHPGQPHTHAGHVPAMNGQAQSAQAHLAAMQQQMQQQVQQHMVQMQAHLGAHRMAVNAGQPMPMLHNHNHPAAQNAETTQDQPRSQSAPQDTPTSMPGDVPRTQPATQQAAPPHRHHHHHHHHRQAHFHPGQNGPAVHVTGTDPNGNPFTMYQQTFGIPNPQLMQAHMPNIARATPQIVNDGLFGPGTGHPLADSFHSPGAGLLRSASQPGVPAGRQNVSQNRSALDIARQNVAEMSNLLSELRQRANEDGDVARVNELEQRIQELRAYIDPFAVGATPADHASRQPSGSSQVNQGQANGNLPLFQPLRSLNNGILPGLLPMDPLAGLILRGQAGGQLRSPSPLMPQQAVPSQQEPVFVHMLSSPQGPQALLFSPQYGLYANNLQQPATLPAGSPATAIAPTPTQPQAPAEDGQQQPNAQPAQGQLAQVEQPADGLGAMQPLLGHFWLLIRIMIFSYILIGSNMGWRRPAALALIGIGFWLLRLGLFGNGGVVRRWWDGIVRIDNAEDRLRRLGLDPAAQQARPQDGVAQQNGADQQQPEPAQAQVARFPTPEELAQRLIQEQRDRSAFHRLREQIRPVERAFALFVASLWPGVGERYVRALDRAREAEETLRRELERQREEATQRDRDEQADREKSTNTAGSSETPQTATHDVKGNPSSGTDKGSSS